MTIATPPNAPSENPRQPRAADGLPGMYQRTTPPTVLASRRTAVAVAIGSGSVALLQGAPQPPGSGLFRQTNELYHLSGIEVPHAYLTIEGGTALSTLYLSHLDAATARVTGPYLNCDDPETAGSATGADRVRPLEALGPDLSGQVLRVPQLRIMVPMCPPELATQSRDDLLAATGAALADPWCDPTSRPAALVARLRSAFPAGTLADLSPVLDAIRVRKDATEISLLRRAGALCAAGITHAMRATAPGRYEYELAAVAGFVFAAGGARGDGYRAIVAGGTNAWHGHWGRQSSELVEGDLVLMDYAPDFAYYTSDIGRMWPVSGRYSDAQRALYGFIVRYHRALLSRLRPGALPDDIMDAAAEEMSGILDRTQFATGAHRVAARGALDFRGHLSHPVGMSVHDVGAYRSAPLQPGTVISIDPMLWIEPEHGYVRCEDTVVITEDGYENLTVDAPLDCDETEAVMRERGLLDRLGGVTVATGQGISPADRPEAGSGS